MLEKFSFVLLLISCLGASAQTETTVYFPFDRFELTGQAQKILDTIGTNNKITSINIYGHCDQIGSKQYNYHLSEQRAKAVKEYLVFKGFGPAGINSIKGFGKDQPAINKLDETSRQSNRRVTVVSIYEVPAIPTVIPPKLQSADTPSVVQTPSRPKFQRKEKLLDEITDTSTKAGQNIILRNINFYGGSHRFLPMSYPSLEELLEVMQKIPSLVIEIQGHICCRDDEGDGMDNDTGEPFLSYNRARAVYTFLVRNGIDKNRMTYKGYGHKYPLYDIEFTEQERTANRRVEIKILKK
jgi:outer membrane protein OmpA-like peptidoglycan-associated protein